jgi:hypothetical protein
MTGKFAVQESSILISESITNSSGCGATDGELEISVSGNNSGNLSFLWTGPSGFTSTDQNLTGLGAGNYRIQVTDIDRGCIAVDTFAVTNPIPFTVTDTTITNQTLCGVDNGAISIDITGSTGDINYHIKQATNAVDTVDALLNTTVESYSYDQLSPGSYKLFIENGGCVDSVEFSIDPFEEITATVVNSIEATCGDSDGEISVEVENPSGLNFDVLLFEDINEAEIASELDQDGSVLNFTFGGLSQGTYTIVIRQLTTCEFRQEIDVNEDAPFIPNTPTVDNITECGEFGSISLTFADANMPTSYAWFNSENDTISRASSIDNLEAGIYGVKLSDANCSVIIRDIEVTQPPECDFQCDDLRAVPITEAASCLGVQDGQIFFLLSNVSASDSLTFHIKPNDSLNYDTYTVANFGNGLIVEIPELFTAGTYNYVIEDETINCLSDTLNLSIGTKSSVSASVDITQPTCNISTGSISVSLSGTADSFTYELYASTDLTTVLETSTTGNFNGIDEGDYVIRFINNNNNGCGVADQNITIENTAIVGSDAVDINIQQPECGSTTGTITAVLNNLPSNYDFHLVDADGDTVATNSTGIFSEVAIGTYLMQFENTVDPDACQISDRGGLLVESVNAFSATVSDTVDVVCFGDNSGSVVITLDGISVGYYSIDNGNLWTEFTSGNAIEGLPAINNILVSDEPGTSDCELSIAVNIEHLSQPITLDGNITLVTQASCTTAEEIGEIRIPEVNGGVAPYTFTIDGEEVTLDADRIIGGLARNVDELTITDDTGCSETFEIGPIVSPNEIRAIVEEINPADNCLDNPEGLRVVIDQNTIDNVTGPYNFIINRVDDTETAEFTLDVDINGSAEFLIGPDENLEFLFEKGVRYRWTLRSVTNEQACSADNFITINAGAIIPTYEVEGINAQCFGQSGSIEITNISADEDLPLVIQLFNDRDDLIRTFTEQTVPLSGNFIIDPNSFGFVETGTYNVQLSQKPGNCTDSIRSTYLPAIVDGPTAELFVELVPEPQLPPGVDRSRSEMNPMPTTRPDFSNGSISIRLVSNTSATGYSAQIFLVEPLGGNNSALYTLPSEPLEFGDDNMLTFDNLLPGVYEIEYYDSFGCGTAGNKLVQNLARDGFDITVDFDRSPFIPNIFTPDGDGINDEFQILNLPDDGAELVVTNRTGAIVFRSASYRPSNLWDGGDLPDGIYFYQLTIDNEVFSGWVEILRGGNK